MPCIRHIIDAAKAGTLKSIPLSSARGLTFTEDQQNAHANASVGLALLAAAIYDSEQETLSKVQIEGRMFAADIRMNLKPLVCADDDSHSLAEALVALSNVHAILHQVTDLIVSQIADSDAIEALNTALADGSSVQSNPHLH